MVFQWSPSDPGFVEVDRVVYPYGFILIYVVADDPVGLF